MPKKTTKVIENSNSLFDDNDIKVTKKPKKIRKITKNKDDNSTDNPSSYKSSSKLLGNDKKPQNMEKTRRTKSKEVGDSSIRKQSDVKESVHKDARKRGKRKSESKHIIYEKPKRKSRKSKNDTVEVQKTIAAVEEKKKTGPKRWKYGFYKGCEDCLVWIEEIGHWVSKSAFTQTDHKHPIYTKENYVQGLDSWWILNCYKPIVKDDSHIWINLEKANKNLNKKYKTWKELSAHPGLTEEFLTEYKDYIDWTTFMFNNVGRTFSNGFRKKFHDKFLILVTFY